ncbi:thiol-disulfide oxidoreductase DCC family protein [Tenacibaculum piscium]|uniref:thiol-disulfide oxidoreductase DCC family protein n=1 Tax=Tenacibaculum piscium TaxID=1458515 RepID=UPI001F2E01C0|nr:DCC1-like thiol-disulfide oxidoreductase family protein [Tenacibaculum piscium]
MFRDYKNHKKIILFDGICNFCNSWVLKVIKLDKKNQFVFVSLQSEIGKKITTHLGIDATKIDSIILYEPNISYDIKSTAVLKIMVSFGGFWRLFSILTFLPEGFRNYCYDFIAKNRYRWFGKREKCILPSEEFKTEIKQKFL